MVPDLSSVNAQGKRQCQDGYSGEGQTWRKIPDAFCASRASGSSPMTLFYFRFQNRETCTCGMLTDKLRRLVQATKTALADANHPRRDIL